MLRALGGVGRRNSMLESTREEIVGVLLATNMEARTVAGRGEKRPA